MFMYLQYALPEEDKHAVHIRVLVWFCSCHCKGMLSSPSIQFSLPMTNSSISSQHIPDGLLVTDFIWCSIPWPSSMERIELLLRLFVKVRKKVKRKERNNLKWILEVARILDFCIWPDLFIFQLETICSGKLLYKISMSNKLDLCLFRWGRVSFLFSSQQKIISARVSWTSATLLNAAYENTPLSQSIKTDSWYNIMTLECSSDLLL